MLIATAIKDEDYDVALPGFISNNIEVLGCKSKERRMVIFLIVTIIPLDGEFNEQRLSTQPPLLVQILREENQIITFLRKQ